MQEIISQAPTRVDIAGGTLDISPLSQIIENKVTVNFAVSLFAEVRISFSENSFFSIESEDQGVLLTGNFNEICLSTQLPLFSRILKYSWNHELPPLKIRVKAKSPAGAGLGGSSSLAIAFMGAISEARCMILDEQKRTDADFVRFVQDIETAVIRVPTGCQDYWGALLGGVNIITYPPGGSVVRNLKNLVPDDFNKSLVLCFSGQLRASGLNNWAIFKKAFDGDKDLLNSLEEIGQSAFDVAHAIERGDWKEAFECSKIEWEIRKKLWPEINTHHTAILEEVAYKSGAKLARVCGAGGGGVMAVVIDPDRREYLVEKLTDAGGKILEGEYISEGLTCRVVDT